MKAGTAIFRGAYEGNRDRCRDFPDGVYVSTDRFSAAQWGPVRRYQTLRDLRVIDLNEQDDPLVRGFLALVADEEPEYLDAGDLDVIAGETFIQCGATRELRALSFDGMRLGDDVFLLGSLADSAEEIREKC